MTNRPTFYSAREAREVRAERGDQTVRPTSDQPAADAANRLLTERGYTFGYDVVRVTVDHVAAYRAGRTADLHDAALIAIADVIGGRMTEIGYAVETVRVDADVSGEEAAALIAAASAGVDAESASRAWRQYRGWIAS